MGWRPSDHAARARRWLLDLTWGDAVYRLSDDHVTFTGSDGVSYFYSAGLVVGGEVERASYVGEGPVSPRAPVELHLQGLVDVPGRIAQGVGLGSARAVLWLWIEGTTHRDRVIDGFLELPEYGEADQAVMGSLVDDRLINRKLFPPANARMGVSAQNPGEYYPWVIGQPGTGLDGAVYGSPGLVWSDSGASPGLVEEILIAGHAVGASQVVVKNANTGASDIFTVATDTDVNGRTVSIVDVTTTGWASAHREMGAAYFVRWFSNALKIRGEAVNGAGDVLLWAMPQTDIVYDVGALLAVRVELNRYKIDCVIDATPEQRVDLWEWVVENVLPILPVSVAQTDLGVRFVLWRYDATPGDAVADLTEGENASRLGDVGYASRDGIANELRFSYGPSARVGRTVFTEVVTGHALTLASDDDASPHVDCVKSDREFGLLPYEWSSQVVWDPATAARVARNEARRRALQPRHVGYAVPPDVGAPIEAGDVVKVSDVAVGIVEALFFVLHKPADEGEFFALHLREITAP